MNSRAALLPTLLAIGLFAVPVALAPGQDAMEDDPDRAGSAPAAPADDRPFTDTFTVADDDFASRGRNDFFILEPGYQLVLAGGGEVVIITVTNETRKVGEVETRVVDEIEFNNGALKEVSRNFIAIDETTNAVYYFGEDVDYYKDGQVSGHHGEWLAGENGAQIGMLMPGSAVVGARFQQENAPGAAMDRGEIVAVGETVVTPAGTFENCLKVEESNPLEPGEREYKFYAPGIGLIQDGDLKLVRHGRAERD